jgi:hypothetical protein
MFVAISVSHSSDCHHQLAPIEAGEPLGKNRNFNTASKLTMAQARSGRG